MKKIVLSLSLLLVAVIFSVSFVFAQDTITETPNVKVVIDGKATTYEDIPLAVSGRTFLPLRAILVNLGVPNDDKHIVWNNEEKSVTVYTDTTKIYLKVGSTTAYVNDQPVTLEVAPMAYHKNERVYIPTRFVAQALGKKVIWDGSSTTVLIRDEKDFNAVKEILDKSNAAGKAINKAKFDTNIKVDMSANGQNISTDVTGSGEYDKDKKVMHMTASTKILGQNMNVEYYFSGGAMYIKMPPQSQWQKVEMPKGIMDKTFESNYNANLDITDALCAGLVVENTSNPDEVILKGDVYAEQLLKSMNSLGSSNNLKLQGIDIQKYNIKMTINKKTNLVSKTEAYLDIAVDVNGNKQLMSEHLIINFDYSGNFEITVPSDIK